MVTKALKAAGVEYEPVVNAGEPSFTLDPNESSKKVLDIIGKIMDSKPTKNAHLGAEVFNNGDVAAIVYMKGRKLNRVTISDQAED